MQRLRLLTIASIIVAGLLYYFSNSKESTLAFSDKLIVDNGWLTINHSPVASAQDRRTPDQTFLTYPEWFLVHSPAEQANYFTTHTATTFPYMTHVKQFWESYAIVSHSIEKYFVYNGDYHMMIKVIGGSITIEYALKAWYETIIGRITDTSKNEPLTQEDRFNHKFTQEYVDFIRVTPWYDFDFSSQLAYLWGDTDFFGSNFLRKLERRYLLTSELLVKIAYAKLIKLGTKTVYEEALLTTVVLVDSFPEESNISSIDVLKRFDNATVLLRVPRYAAFNQTAVNLAKKNISFIEIAGNNGAILLTLLVDTEFKFNIDNTQVLFEQSIPSHASQKRMAVITKASTLSKTLRNIVAKGITIEHIYDF